MCYYSYVVKPTNLEMTSIEESLLHTDPKRRDVPCRALGESTRTGQEAEGTREKWGYGSLFWFP